MKTIKDLFNREVSLGSVVFIPGYVNTPSPTVALYTCIGTGTTTAKLVFLGAYDRDTNQFIPRGILNWWTTNTRQPICLAPQECISGLTPGYITAVLQEALNVRQSMNTVKQIKNTLRELQEIT